MSDDTPNPGTKAALEAENAQLRDQVDNLRGQLVAAAGATPAGYQPAQRFFLSEGDRQELELHGVANIGGRLLTRDQVLAKLAGGPQSAVEIREPKVDRTADAAVAAARAEPRNVRGVTFVYPSVADGLIDPAVAGKPGINGPAATPAAVAELAELSDDDSFED
jgi:hypothetical protein